MNPGDRPRKTLLTVIGAVAAAAAVAGIAVVADTDPAAAAELERFASCEALEAWSAPPEAAEDVPDESSASRSADPAVGESPAAAADTLGGGSSSGTGGGQGGDADGRQAYDESMPVPQSTDALAATGGGADDGTNVIVEGVDELDVIDHLDQRHVLVAAASRLSIVDLVDHRVVANLPVSWSVESTYDADRGIAWVVGPDDDGRLTVTRVAVTPTSLVEEASWSTDGWLVDARRIGGELHLVAADGGYGGIVPFASRPVPCDQVLHPTSPSDSAATLVVTLPAEGDLEPTAATEVVGSGEQVHVTLDAVYLATPLYGDTVRTSLHRFDLDDLTLTGSGVVDGVLLNEFSMSAHDGHLRVAVTDGTARFGMPIEGDVAIDPAMSTGGAAAESARMPVETILNQVVVLDTDGALDVVGRTPRFGHPGETIQGIRFDGTVAYAVTFLQTDPFYVLDLADPTRPRVEGEVELPGFSSYLHPIADGLVAGFGPGEDGRIAVKLFDVSDRTQPKVVDTYVLGDESAIAWDHHAYVDLGDGRFAVPTSSYRELRPAGCTPQRQADLQSEERRLQDEMSTLWGDGPDGPAPADQARIDQLQADANRIYGEGCLYPRAVPESSVVVLDASGGRLQLVQRLGAVRSDESASRVVPTDDGWALLAGNHWFVVDRSGDQIADLELGPAPDASTVGVDGRGSGPQPLVID